MTTAYGSDVTTLTEQELIAAMKALASNWREAPHLSNEHSEGIRYHEIKKALLSRFGIEAYISADSHPTDYQLNI